MKTKKDIENRADIESLVNVFYEKVKLDPVIVHFFTRVVPVDWEKHLPIMYRFWENIVFHTGEYEGNPMAQHQAIHEKCPMSTEHFKTWVNLFNETVNELFQGENAEKRKQRALSIATVMQIRILH
jgi:hemoglobin